MNHAGKKSTARRQHGIALLLVLGVLALLSVLALTFVHIAKLEANISRNYVDYTRAKLVAESGVDAAISHILNFEGGVLRAPEIQALRYDNANHIASFQIPGLAVPASGIVSGSYVQNGDYFSLQTEDESAKLNLNDSNGKWFIHFGFRGCFNCVA